MLPGNVKVGTAVEILNVKHAQSRNPLRWGRSGFPAGVKDIFEWEEGRVRVRNLSKRGHSTAIEEPRSSES